MSYDNLKNHVSSAREEGSPAEQGGVHIGMFLAWMVLHGLAHADEDFGEPEMLRDRSTTPTAYLRDYCDGQLSEDDLTDEGNAFAVAYYNGDDPLVGMYLDDWGQLAIGDEKKSYAVPDTWKIYDRIAPVIASRHASWKTPPSLAVDTSRTASRPIRKRAWWEFWK
jgi:hypothetical protein